MLFSKWINSGLEQWDDSWEHSFLQSSEFLIKCSNFFSYFQLPHLSESLIIFILQEKKSWNTFSKPSVSRYQRYLLKRIRWGPFHSSQKRTSLRCFKTNWLLYKASVFINMELAYIECLPNNIFAYRFLVHPIFFQADT